MTDSIAAVVLVLVLLFLSASMIAGASKRTSVTQLPVGDRKPPTPANVKMQKNDER